jgi:hypothetical protein
MIENKVKASTSAAAVSGLILWVLGRYVFRGEVPDVLASWIYAVLPGVLAFGAGYLARHTPRPDLEAPPLAADIRRQTLIPERNSGEAGTVVPGEQRPG